VNRQQLAELMGVHPDTVTDYARSGMPVIARGGAGREGVYDAVACLDWWRSQQGKNAKEAAQTRAYEATAALNEQRLQERRKELLERDQVVLAGQGYTKAWTAKVRALPRRFIEAGLLTREQEAAAATVCRDVLMEIASWKTLDDVGRVAKGKTSRKAKEA
jgi:phage terminase Nu1 subunit (DNA packaging protein)